MELKWNQEKEETQVIEDNFLPTALIWLHLFRYRVPQRRQFRNKSRGL